MVLATFRHDAMALGENPYRSTDFCNNSLPSSFNLQKSSIFCGDSFAFFTFCLFFCILTAFAIFFLISSVELKPFLSSFSEFPSSQFSLLFSTGTRKSIRSSSGAENFFQYCSIAFALQRHNFVFEP